MPIISQSVTITPPNFNTISQYHPSPTWYIPICHIPYPPSMPQSTHIHHISHLSYFIILFIFHPITHPPISHPAHPLQPLLYPRIPPFLHLQPHLQTVGYIFNGIFKPKKIKKHTKFFCPLKNKSYLCIAFGKCTIPTASWLRSSVGRATDS